MEPCVYACLRERGSKIIKKSKMKWRGESESHRGRREPERRERMGTNLLQSQKAYSHC